MKLRCPTFVAVTVMITLAAVQPAVALTPAHLWSGAYGASSTDAANGVTTDAAGNVYVIGHFSNSVNFGGSTLASVGSNDIFIAKYNSSGVHQWSQRYGSTGDDRGTSITESGGRLYVTGQFGGTVSFGGGNLVSVGSLDIFLVAITIDGGHLWSRGFGSASNDVGAAVVTEGDDVFMTGYFQGTADFGGGPLVSAGSYDVIVARYDFINGNHVWSSRYGSNGFDQGLAIALDASSNVCVAGDFSNTVNFGGGNLVSSGLSDTFIAKYTQWGAHLWSKGAGSTSNDFAYGIAVDGSGNVYACGYFALTVNLGGSNLVSAGSQDMFLVRYDASGTHQWSRRFGSTSSDVALGLAVDPSGSIAMTGYCLGSVDFGSGPLNTTSWQVCLARFDANGTSLMSQAYGSMATDIGRAAAFDPSGDVFVVGELAGTGSLGGDMFPGAGSTDAFVAKYSAVSAEPVISAIDDIGNDQGRQVKITFARSGHDQATASTPIVHYEAYRRSDAPPANVFDAALRSGRQLLDLGWTQVGSVNSHGQDGYSIDVPTIGDSTVTLGQYRSTFFVRAATSDPLGYFDSPADSGYSIDNLAPGAPQNFVYDAGDLAWDESNAADFDYFTVYGSDTDNFGSATVVDYSVAPTMDVSGSPYVFYFVTATDFSGNEGQPAKINTLSNAGGTPKSYVLSVTNFPNPFNPRTTVNYTVPSRGAVTIMLYDARGARVATLFIGERGAGAYSLEWDGRGDDGVAVSSGVYFARIQHAGSIRTRKMVLLK